MAEKNIEALGMIETRGFTAMVEASDAMVKALTDDKLRQTMKRNAKKSIKEHELAGIIETWEDIYKDLIQKNKDKPKPLKRFVESIKNR